MGVDAATGSFAAARTRNTLLGWIPSIRYSLPTTKLIWILRISIAMEFIGHGAFGIIGKEAWVPYFQLFGFSEDWAWRIMPVVGALDISIGILTFFLPVRAVLLHMSFWGLMTAFLRPATGEGWWEVFERGGNYAVPIALLLVAGLGGRSLKRWFTPLREFMLTPVVARRLAWVLRVGTALLLIGHGGFGVAMHKQAWIGYLGELGVGASTVSSLNLVSVIGLFEIALGLAVLLKPANGLLIFVMAWKIGTELLRPMAGEPWWEFIERGGSYCAPLALIIVNNWLRRRSHWDLPDVVEPDVLETQPSPPLDGPST
jgi:hypothetical protein